MATKRRIENPDIVAFGEEPIWTDAQHDMSEQHFKIAVGDALNWYNYFYNKKDAKKTLVTYLKQHKFDKDILAAVQKAPDWSIGSTIVSICKMRNNGLVRSSNGANSDAFFTRKLDEIVEIGKKSIEPEEDDKPKAPAISIQQRMLESASKLAEPIEEAIDNFTENKFKGEFDTFAYLQKEQVKGMIAQKILGFYSGEADELEEALEGKCEQLKEGYSHIKKAELKRYAKFIRGICDDIQRFISNTKAVRKPRKTKAKPVSKQVEKVQYAKSNPEFKLQSIPPEKVVGAMQLWVFNVKYRTLGVYNATSRDGFSFKGTTLQGFDPDTSIKKKLRKPEDALQRCLTGGKIVMRKLMDEITTKESSLNGRMNNETILLRVMK
jgi:hypothetical protein